MLNTLIILFIFLDNSESVDKGFIKKANETADNLDAVSSLLFKEKLEFLNEFSKYISEQDPSLHIFSFELRSRTIFFKLYFFLIFWKLSFI